MKVIQIQKLTYKIKIQKLIQMTQIIQKKMKKNSKMKQKIIKMIIIENLIIQIPLKLKKHLQTMVKLKNNR